MFILYLVRSLVSPRVISYTPSVRVSLRYCFQQLLFLWPATGSTAIRLKFYSCCLAPVCWWRSDTLKSLHIICVFRVGVPPGAALFCCCPCCPKSHRSEEEETLKTAWGAPLSASCLFDKVATCQRPPAHPLPLENKGETRANCSF